MAPCWPRWKWREIPAGWCCVRCRVSRWGGELTLSLVDGDGQPIFHLSFSLLRRADGCDLCIGGVQGVCGNLEQVRLLTKRLHGLRPPILLLHVAGALCAALGLEHLFAVRNHSHVYRRFTFNRERKNRIALDYDTLWSEAGGEVWRRNPKFVRMPLAPQAKPLSEVASNKRAMNRRRYDLLDALRAEVSLRVSQMAAVALPARQTVQLDTVIA